MRYLGLTLIGLALALVGLAAGLYIAADEPLSEEVWKTPGYEPRASYSGPPPPDPMAGIGADEARRVLHETLQEPDPFVRTPRLAEQLAGMGPADVEAILATLTDPTLELGASEYALLTRFWAQQEPEAALRWAAASSPTSFRVAALLPAMEEQARRDPAVALAVLNEMNAVPNPYSAAAQVALVRGWYDGGIGGLEDYIRHLGIGYERQRLMGEFARRAIMRDGPNHIMAWAQSLPDEDHKFKITAYRRVGVELAKLHPQAAVAWCEAVCDGEFGSSVRQVIAQRWAARDGRAAMLWAKSAAPGQERDWAVSGAYRGWWRQDPEAFHAWLLEETENGARIEPWLLPALRNYPAHIAQMGAASIDEALAWAARIPDEQQRWRAYVSVGRIWYKRDPEAASAWIDQSPLDEQGRAAVRALGTRNPYDQPRDQQAADADEGAAASAEASDAEAAPESNPS